AASPSPTQPPATSPPAQHPAPSNQTITIQGFAFNPSNLSIGVGSTVKAMNQDSTTHTWTADNGAWNSGDLGMGQTSMAVPFNSAGTFTYHCSRHPSMTGSITVS